MENNELAKRYKTLPKHHGIREDSLTKTYQVTKSIRGKRYYKIFPRLADAIRWKNEFHPDINFTQTDAQLQEIEFNGVKDHSFSEAWEIYKSYKFPALSPSTIEKKLIHEKTFESLMSIKMKVITPEVIRDFIIQKKKEINIRKTQRFHFNNDLKELKAFFNWYSDEIDYKFICPVKRSHFSLGILRPLIHKDLKISLEDCLRFLDALPQPYKDFATLQYLTASRVQEIAGLQKQNIDLERKTLVIKEVVVWRKRKDFCYLKPLPKNGSPRYCHITSIMLEILNRVLMHIPSKCNYVFSENGEPFKYRKIQHYYNTALITCDLGDKFSGTHFLRHGMATTTRDITGSLDYTQAMTGHKDIRLAEHYGSLPNRLQKEASLAVENKILEIRNACSCDQNAIKPKI